MPTGRAFLAPNDLQQSRRAPKAGARQIECRHDERDRIVRIRPDTATTTEAATTTTAAANRQEPTATAGAISRQAAGLMLFTPRPRTPTPLGQGQRVRSSQLLGCLVVGVFDEEHGCVVIQPGSDVGDHVC